MGISHQAILNVHPDVQVVAACDSNSYVTDVLARHTGLRCFSKYDEMLREVEADAVVIATPSRLHADMVDAALARNLAVFCEKPFVLDWQRGEDLVTQAESKRLVTQVGYHFRFVAAFEE